MDAIRLQPPKEFVNVFQINMKIQKKKFFALKIKVQLKPALSIKCQSQFQFYQHRL